MKSLHKPEVWEKVLSESEDQPVILFKHSNSCPVSAEAHKRIKKLDRQDVVSESMYIVIVQNAREISDLIAEELEVKHESPQILIIRNREAVYHASHGDIMADTVAQELIKAR
ncbi:MAG: bacillithiol system redox-active protein YtxJ [Candidatus Paceibacterota bacterium]